MHTLPPVSPCSCCTWTLPRAANVVNVLRMPHVLHTWSCTYDTKPPHPIAALRQSYVYCTSSFAHVQHTRCAIHPTRAAHTSTTKFKYLFCNTKFSTLKQNHSLQRHRTSTHNFVYTPQYAKKRQRSKKRHHYTYMKKLLPHIVK